MAGLEQFRRALYKLQRGIGDYQALRSGGPRRYVKRVARRRSVASIARSIQRLDR